MLDYEGYSEYLKLIGIENKNINTWKGYISENKLRILNNIERYKNLSDKEKIVKFSNEEKDFKDTFDHFHNYAKKTTFNDLRSGARRYKYYLQYLNVSKTLKEFDNNSFSFDLNGAYRYFEIFNNGKKYPVEVICKENIEILELPSTFSRQQAETALEKIFDKKPLINIKFIDISSNEIQKNNNLKKSEYKNMKTKNIMLYGAPGVGKTHNYKRLITMIEQGKDEKTIFETISKNENTKDFDNSIFENIKKENRLEFVTFHQSYSYEDFIEGFRPQDDGTIKLENGIFKSLVEHLEESESLQNIGSYLQEGLQYISEKPTIWKMSLGKSGEFKEECFKNGSARIGWDNYGNLDLVETIKQRELKDFYSLELGDIILAFKNKWEIDGIGIVTGEYKFNEHLSSYKHEREVNWIIKNKTINIKQYNKNIGLTTSTLYKLSPRVSKNDILEMINLYTNQNQKNIRKDQKNYYMVIDEINRGNISKIFGELITLIEEDKRGKKEYEVTLPYSKTPFLIPSNLYIIATMNSTDKSIATIDIALRRRFTFLKMKPQESIVKETSIEKAFNLFQDLNKFIKENIGEDYQLGHSYFMYIKNEDDLDFVKKYKIEPLLEEYFYGDDGKLDEVLKILNIKEQI